MQDSTAEAGRYCSDTPGKSCHSPKGNVGQSDQQCTGHEQSDSSDLFLELGPRALLTPKGKFETCSDWFVIFLLILQFSLQLTDKVLFYLHSAGYLSSLDKGYYMLSLFQAKSNKFPDLCCKTGVNG